MNHRQWKKKIYRKAMPHGYWKKYKQAERQLHEEILLPAFRKIRQQYPNRHRTKKYQNKSKKKLK